MSAAYEGESIARKGERALDLYKLFECLGKPFDYSGKPFGFGGKPFFRF